MIVTRIFPIFLLVSSPLLAMERDGNNGKEIIKAGSWTRTVNLDDRGIEQVAWLFNESDQESLPLSREERPVDLASTMVLTNNFRANQEMLAQIKEKSARIKEEEQKQEEKTQVGLEELQKRLAGKQSAEIGSNIRIMDLEKRINNLSAEKELETNLRDEHIKTIAQLKATISFTQAEAKKELEKKAQESKKRGWFW